MEEGGGKILKTSQRFIVGIPEKMDEALSCFLHHPPGGILLLKHNFPTWDRGYETIHALRALFPGLRFFIDHEGGQVNRLAHLIGRLPQPATMARWSLKLIEATAWQWANFLKNLGIDGNLAPCVDLGPPQPGTGLETRLWGDHPHEVVPRALAFIRGMHRGGILTCLKHFPGLGLASMDTHRALPHIHHTQETLDFHLAPFKKLAPYGDFIMMNHAHYTLSHDGLPASLSPFWVREAKKLGPLGIITDDMEMGALEATGDLKERMIQAIEAGNHWIILSHAWWMLEFFSSAKKHPFKPKPTV